MNIIQVCPYDLSIPGGVQTHITHLSNQLVKKNHNVVVLAPTLTNPDFKNTFDCEVIHIAEPKRIKLWGTAIDLSYLNKEEKKQLGKVLDTFKPDIVHFHTIWNPIMQTQILNMLKSGIKKVGTFHDTPPDVGIGKYIGGNLMRAGAMYYLPRVDEIISVSKTQSRAMGIREDNPLKNFQIIPNGVHSNPQKSSKSNPGKSDKFKLIFVGRFEKRKGLMDLLEVYDKLKKEVTSKKIMLRILGNGPLRGKAEAFINEKKLDDIKFIHETNEEDKCKWLAGSDLLVAPSLYGESFGIILLEAMALKVKVAGYGNPGYMNLGVEYGKENFPPPGDKEGLLALIKKHIMHPEESDHLISKGEQIAAKHDWKLITDKVDVVYNKSKP